jgi:hypothetical protein
MRLGVLAGGDDRKEGEDGEIGESAHGGGMAW